MLECFWYGNKHSFIRVGVFSVEVRFLCYVMVDFDGWFPFLDHFCSPSKDRINGNNWDIKNWVIKTLKAWRQISESNKRP